MAGIWAEVLKLERVGRHDNFFELGGHSLLAVTLIERIRRMGLPVDVKALFATPTLAELAAAVDSQPSLLEVPPNRIPSGCEAITPEMLPLVQLKVEEIERIVAGVVGGVTNVQDIYPLAPLQEGILFHHLMGGEGDPYLLASQISFDSRARLESYLKAMQAVIDRHDILRTAVIWEGISEPVQVVWRKAILSVEEVELDTAAGDAAGQLYERFNPRHYRIDIRQAPLLRIYVAYDRAQGRWLMMRLLHHLVGDHSALEVMQEEIQAHLLGETEQLGVPVPFRNLVAQARLGISKEEHEAYFPEVIGRRRGADGAIRTVGCAWGRHEDKRSSVESGCGSGAADSGRGTEVGGECGECVPLGVGAGVGAGIGTRGCGIRDSSVRTHARWSGRGPCDGTIHQHAAGADPDWGRGSRGERAANTQATG